MVTGFCPSHQESCGDLNCCGKHFAATVRSLEAPPDLMDKLVKFIDFAGLPRKPVQGLLSDLGDFLNQRQGYIVIIIHNANLEEIQRALSIDNSRLEQFAGQTRWRFLSDRFRRSLAGFFTPQLCGLYGKPVCCSSHSSPVSPSVRLPVQPSVDLTLDVPSPAPVARPPVPPTAHPLPQVHHYGPHTGPYNGSFPSAQAIHHPNQFVTHYGRRPFYISPQQRSKSATKAHTLSNTGQRNEIWRKEGYIQELQRRLYRR